MHRSCHPNRFPSVLLIAGVALAAVVPAVRSVSTEEPQSGQRAHSATSTAKLSVSLAEEIPQTERQAKVAPTPGLNQHRADPTAVDMIGEDTNMHVGRVLGGVPVHANGGNLSPSRAAGELVLGMPCDCDEDCAAVGDQCNLVQCIVRSTCTGDHATPCSSNGDCTGNGTCDTASGAFVQRCDKVQLIGWPCDVDADFCTLDRCQDDASGNKNSICVPQNDTADGSGGNLSPCAKQCAGGPAAGLDCDRASDCAQGSCRIMSGGGCDGTAGSCYVGGSLATALGRCCAAGVCIETDETACTGGGGAWYRYRSPDEIEGDGDCLCPKYGSGVAPPGSDLGSSAAFGLVRPSGLICQWGSLLSSETVYCEDPDGDGFSPKFCQQRCVGGDNHGAPCLVDNPDCARAGTCSTTGQFCVFANGGSDCGTCTAIGGQCLVDTDCPAPEICVFDGSQTCIPSNPGTCVPDDCLSNLLEGGCEDGLLSIGDDYGVGNGSFLRLTQFRFRGGVTNQGEDIVIEFWDSTGTRLVDAFAIDDLPLTGTHDWTIEVDCWPNCNLGQNELPEQKPIIIPPNGYVVMRATRTVGTTDGAAAFWEQTDSPPDAGSNDSQRSWVDGNKDADLGTNVYSFELVGTKVPDPLGGCCDDAASCEDTHRWECGVCSETDPPVLCASTLHDCPGGGLHGSVCQFDRWFGPISHTEIQFGGTNLTLCNGIQPCDKGACCSGEACSVLSEADCMLAAGDFQGIATDCTPNCCPVTTPTGSDCVCSTSTCVQLASSCLGGADDGAPCTTSADCDDSDPSDPGVCGHLNLGLLCDSDADCEAGIATCVLQCEPTGVTQLRHPYECHDDFGSPLKPRVDCDPGNGNADCNTALFETCKQSFTGALAVARNDTISGDLFTAMEGERCSINGSVDHVGWYELISLEDSTPGDDSDDCFRLTVGLCCTDPLLAPIWPFLSSLRNCPCVDNADVIAQSPDFDISGDSLGGFGADSKARVPCEDGNYSATFTVPPGNYAYQIYADSSCVGSMIPCEVDDDCPGSSCVVPNADYSVHFTTESCQIAACCLGSTCILTNRLSCEAQSGNFLGGGGQPIVTCQQGACAMGACCVDGQCKDDAFSDQEAECLAQNGVYFGSVSCDQSPCPACPFDFPANCQQVQTTVGPVPLIDRNPDRNNVTGEGTVLADDVKFADGTVDEICWNAGFYAEPCCSSGSCVMDIDDSWEIRIYGPDPGGCNGLPGPEINRSSITVLNKIEGRGQEAGTWHYAGTLVDPIVLTGTPGLAGDTYWFEISAFGEPGCGIRANWSRDRGNDHHVASQVSAPGGARDYNLAGVADVDVGFCENSGIGNPGNVLGSCCKCPANCQENFTQRDCRAVGGVWSACATCAESTCPDLPSNDNCESPLVVTGVPTSPDGSAFVTIAGENICATDDGPGLSDTGGCAGSLVDGGGMHNDVWYSYIAEDCGDLRINGCGASNQDQMIAIYDASNGCPLTSADELTCSDDGCGIVGGASDVTWRVFPGQELLVRIGGWNDEVRGGFTGDPRGNWTTQWSLALNCSPLEPPVRALPPHDILKNRYISIDPRGAMQTNPPRHHIRVMLDSSQVSGQIGSGPWWAGPPGPSNDFCRTPCISLVTSTKPASEPDWSDCSTVHLTGCPIIPTTAYAIAVETGGVLSPPGRERFYQCFDGDFPMSPAVFCDPANGDADCTSISCVDSALCPFGKTPCTGGFCSNTANGTCENSLLRTQLKPGNRWCGDCVGFFNGENWTPPNSVTSIDDAVAAIKTFQNCLAPNAAHLSVVDMHPNLNGEQINRLVNIGDIFAIILCFQGFEYNGPDLTQCE